MRIGGFLVDEMEEYSGVLEVVIRGGWMGVFFKAEDML